MAADTPALAPPPKVTEVETHGVEPIPAAERTAGPLDLFRLTFGGANTIATVVLGSFPIIFGLSFRDALFATLLGVMLGAAILAPMALFGPRNGTNNAVSSSAHLGVHGRVVGLLPVAADRRRVLLDLGVDLGRRARRRSEPADRRGRRCHAE